MGLVERRAENAAAGSFGLRSGPIRVAAVETEFGAGAPDKVFLTL